MVLTSECPNSSCTSFGAASFESRLLVQVCRNLRECVNSENVGQVEELLLMTEQMQDELDQKDETIMELNTAKQIADLEREIEQRKQSREYRSIADKIKANRATINQRDRQPEKSRRRSRGMEI